LTLTGLTARSDDNRFSESPHLTSNRSVRSLLVLYGAVTPFTFARSVVWHPWLIGAPDAVPWSEALAIQKTRDIMIESALLVTGISKGDGRVLSMPHAETGHHVVGVARVPTRRLKRIRASDHLSQYRVLRQLERLCASFGSNSAQECVSADPNHPTVLVKDVIKRGDGARFMVTVSRALANELKADC
jgi:hypothetical protein